MSLPSLFHQSKRLGDAAFLSAPSAVVQSSVSWLRCSQEGTSLVLPVLRGLECPSALLYGSLVWGRFILELWLPWPEAAPEHETIKRFSDAVCPAGACPGNPLPHGAWGCIIAAAAFLIFSFQAVS